MLAESLIALAESLIRLPLLQMLSTTSYLQSGREAAAVGGRRALLEVPLAQLKFRAASAVANTYAEIIEARRRAEQ